MNRYRFSAAERDHYPVRRICQVLGVPTSGYYAWQADQQRYISRYSNASIAKSSGWSSTLAESIRVAGPDMVAGRHANVVEVHIFKYSFAIK